mmetsp:Transcript_98002/g.224721  ORF Transcript_98002/g.224721 Transcript_98002/m.224721 type:complete len:335 (+) Transcript_98002:75-1079(+)
MRFLLLVAVFCSAVLLHSPRAGRGGGVPHTNGNPVARADRAPTDGVPHTNSRATATQCPPRRRPYNEGQPRPVAAAGRPTSTAASKQEDEHAPSQQPVHVTLRLKVLTVDTPLGHDRLAATLGSMATESHFRELSAAFHGVFFRDFTSVQDMLVHQTLVPPLSAKIKRKAESMSQRDRGGGAVACALGHYAIWLEAMQAPGWTVVLEDDAVLQRGWTAQMLQHVLDKSTHDVVWLEGRSCPHMVEPGQGRAMSRVFPGGFGTTAYAISPKGAAWLVEQYDFGRPVDLWMQENADAVCEVSQDHSPRLPLLPFKEGKARSEIRSPLPSRRKQWDD